MTFTLDIYNAASKLASHMGYKEMNTDDFAKFAKCVFIVKPLENGVGSKLKVYGVKTIDNGVKKFIFYCADYGFDRFHTVTTRENPLKVRQNGDATLVGSKVVGW